MKKRTRILLAAAAVLACGGLLLVFGLPYARYRSALARETTDEKIQALLPFAQEDYLDAVRYLEQARHDKAEELLEAGAYAEALAYAQSWACFGGEEIARYEDELEAYEVRTAYAQAVDTFDRGEYRQARERFAALHGYEGSAAYITLCSKRLQLQKAEDALSAYDYPKAEEILRALSGFEDADARLMACEEQKLERLSRMRQSSQNLIACGAWYGLAGGEAVSYKGQGILFDPTQYAGGRVYSGLFSGAVLQEGRVTCVGSGLGDGEEIASWEGVTDLAVGWGHMAALCSDGTAKAAGDDLFGQCRVEEWKDLADIAAGHLHTVGVKADGTAVACGSDLEGQCQVSGWKDVAQVACGLYHTVGLRSDGTVLACGDNTYGQCNVISWRNIVMIYAAGNNTYGLCEDGTVLACGDDSAGQTKTQELSCIVALAPGMWNLAALRADGQVEYVGSALYGQDGFFRKCRVLDVPLYETLQTVRQVNRIYAEYVWGEGREKGPWTYVGGDIAVAIYYDRCYDNSCYRSDLRLTDRSLPVGVFAGEDGRSTRTLMPAALARKHRVILGQTAEYISHSGNPKGVQIHAGVVYYDKKQAPTMAVLPGGILAVYEKGEITAEELLALGVTESWAFGPILVKDGEIHPSVAGHYLHEVNFRSALGMYDPYHFTTMATDYRGSPTLTLLAQKFVDIGCSAAYNLDGGNSTGLTFLGEQINTHIRTEGGSMGQRSMPDMLAFGFSQLVPAMDAPYTRQVNVP